MNNLIERLELFLELDNRGTIKEAIDTIEAQNKAIINLEARLKDLERLSDEAVRAAEGRTRDLESALANALDMVSRRSETNATLRRFYDNG
jgi:hypothetical protein